MMNDQRPLGSYTESLLKQVADLRAELGMPEYEGSLLPNALEDTLSDLRLLKSLRDLKMSETAPSV